MLNQGFIYIPQFIIGEPLEQISKVLLRYHDQWLQRSKDHFNSGGLNSAYITDSKHMSSEDRLLLFSLIGGSEITSLLDQIEINKPRFLNTQLFFNPKDVEQKNYWHRDIQYTGMLEDEQKATIESEGTQVVHFRIALKDEPGVAIVPGSHARWDTNEEYLIRSAEQGRNVHDSIEGSKEVSLMAGDLLIFDANMIHRGLYGDDRLSFDILYCEDNPAILQYRASDCMPNEQELKQLTSSPKSFTEIF